MSLKNQQNCNTLTQDTQQLTINMQNLEVHPNASRREAGANWNALRAKRQTSLDKKVVSDPDGSTSNTCTSSLSKSARVRLAKFNRYVAIDCEMVGVGTDGDEDMLARVSIVNKRGDVLLDKFVKPYLPVTDYRTCVSGIRPQDIANGEDFRSVQSSVLKLLKGKILVGHAIRNDLRVLHIRHQNINIRDTSRYKPLSKLFNGHTPSLKNLTKSLLNKEIQTGEHDSVEDARAAMSIYNCVSGEWEKYLKTTQRRK